MKKRNTDGGMMIVEATIVFPVMFLVIFLMLFAGNAYLQKCRAEAIVQKYAIEGAAYCADPVLDDVISGNLPANGLNRIDIRPYRYFLGGMNDIESNIQGRIRNNISNMTTGLFSGMKPTDVYVDVKYHNYFIYSTFSVNANYKIKLPVKLLGKSDFIFMNVSSRVNMPVTDVPEFIRNVDMIDHYMQRTGVTTKIQELVNKAKEWFKK